HDRRTLARGPWAGGQEVVEEGEARGDGQRGEGLGAEDGSRREGVGAPGSLWHGRALSISEVAASEAGGPPAPRDVKSALQISANAVPRRLTTPPAARRGRSLRSARRRRAALPTSRSPPRPPPAARPRRPSRSPPTPGRRR